MAAVRIVLGETGAYSYSDYDRGRVGTIKTLPSYARRWDRQKRARWIDPDYVAELADLLREFGDTVTVQDETEHSRAASGAGQKRRTSSSDLQDQLARLHAEQQRLTDQCDALRAQRDDARTASRTWIRNLQAEVTQLQQENQRLHRASRTASRSWAEELLSRCGPNLSETVFRRLSSALHPDVAGNTALQQELNTARRGVSR